MRAYLKLLVRDRAALAGAIFIAVLVAVVVLGKFLLGDRASDGNFSDSLNSPSFSNGIGGLLGADTLGRSNLFRIIDGGFTSLSIATCAGVVAALVGSTVGLIAGYRGGFGDSLAMRAADVILSFPMLLLALVILYMLDPRPANVVLLLAISRMPAYLRVVRAETKEVKERLFVEVARCRGASGAWICRKEIAPVVLPTVVTLFALDLGLLMLIESALSYLGVGIQAPNVSWGSLVAGGREYIGNAWWLAFFPGLAIFLFALSSNMVSNWIRIASDPAQRWRVERVAGSLSPFWSRRTVPDSIVKD